MFYFQICIDFFIAVLLKLFSHGGLSPSLNYLDQIRIIDRFREIPHEGAFADLMWSDPDPEKCGFVVSPRGAGYVFGKDVVDQFLRNRMKK